MCGRSHSGWSNVFVGHVGIRGGLLPSPLVTYPRKSLLFHALEVPEDHSGGCVERETRKHVHETHHFTATTPPLFIVYWIQLVTDWPRDACLSTASNHAFYQNNP